MIYQSTNFFTRQRLALKVCAGNLMTPCGAPARALEIVMV
jgi:hypothetical protein